MSGGNTGGAPRDTETAATAAGAPPTGTAVANVAIGAVEPTISRGFLPHAGQRLPAPGGTSAAQWLHSIFAAATAPPRSRSLIGRVMRTISSRVIGPRRK